MLFYSVFFFFTSPSGVRNVQILYLMWRIYRVNMFSLVYCCVLLSQVLCQVTITVHVLLAVS